MLSYEEALERLLTATAPLGVETVAVDAAEGRTLARAVAARLTQPPFAASAMDGYAVRFADMPGPWRILGESAAGKRFGGIVEPGTAVRIFTGAPLPEGADTVIVQEDTAPDGYTLKLSGDGPPHAGAHIRRAGHDFNEGEALIAAGTRLSPPQIGLAAAAGYGTLDVRKRPRVALIATGDELVPPGTLPAADQIVSSNGVMLAALLRAAGADVRDFGIVRDDREAITAAIREASDTDLLVTIGGASVGDHDYVHAALAEAGGTLEFWRVAIKPGKPLIAGSLGGARVLGLPGNPVSAYVCAVLFALPMLRRMAGLAADMPLVTAPLLAPLPANGNRRDHLRASLDVRGVMPFTAQDSSMLGVLAASNVLIIRAPGAAAAKAGETALLLVLDRIPGVP